MSETIKTTTIRRSPNKVINTTGDNSVLDIGNALKSYLKDIELYESMGYAISEADAEKFSFTATKTEIIPD